VSLEEAKRFVDFVGGPGEFGQLLGEGSDVRSVSGMSDISEEGGGAQKARVMDDGGDEVAARQDGGSPGGRRGGTKRGRKPETASAVVSPELHLRMSQDLTAHLKTARGEEATQEAFNRWAEQALSLPELRTELARWLESPATTHFLVRELAIKPANLFLLQDALAASGSDEPHGFRVYRAGPTPTIGDLKGHLRGRKSFVASFDFVHSLNAEGSERARLSAEVLVKQGLFVASCPNSRVKMRQIRFRARTSGGRTALEARFVGSLEKYPALQPWVTPEDREDVMFFGALGREVSSIRRDLFERAEEDWDASMPMQGGRVFHATLFRSQPILWIFTLHAGLVLSEFCIGAANEQVIQSYLLHLDELSSERKRLLDAGQSIAGHVS